MKSLAGSFKQGFVSMTNGTIVRMGGGVRTGIVGWDFERIPTDGRLRAGYKLMGCAFLYPLDIALYGRNLKGEYIRF